jgi:hypothetical protein
MSQELGASRSYGYYERWILTEFFFSIETPNARRQKEQKKQKTI